MTIGDRLREERERLGFSQPALAGLAETTKKSQIDYEKGITFPKANYLEVISKVGVDVQYVVTGVRSASLMGDEGLLLEGFRKMDSETRRRTLAMVYAGTPPAAPAPPTITTSVQATTIHHSIGTNTAPITINKRGKE